MSSEIVSNIEIVATIIGLVFWTIYAFVYSSIEIHHSSNYTEAIISRCYCPNKSGNYCQKNNNHNKRSKIHLWEGPSTMGGLIAYIVYALYPISLICIIISCIWKLSRLMYFMTNITDILNSPNPIKFLWKNKWKF